ncbi:MAG: sensor domain-containing diguanylate cyclase [Tissierellia bacterium]|nr:sensor domain-containing diguanylate cyclase [Tissierellia bacterium]
MEISDLYSSILENLQEGIYFVDNERKITFWNKGAELITGFTADEIIGRHCYDNILNHIDEDGNKLCLQGCPLHETLQDGKNRESSVYLHHKNGQRVKISANITPIIDEKKIIGSVESFREVSENKPVLFDESDNYTKAELRIIALHDQLTGIPNRRYAESFLNSRVNEYNELGIEFGLIFADIDNFGSFNNNYGHELGDKVLQVVSKTFLSATRKNDLVGRWGGEEFLIIFPGINESDLIKISEKIRMLVENSILRENEQNLKVTISIGATMIRSGDNSHSIVNRADDLMYQSKQKGKNRSTFG